MIPVNQVILGGGDPLLGTTTIGATIEDRLQFLEKQKQLLETARQRQLQQLPQPAQPQVQQMYHTEGGRKYVGEKFDMMKAKEVCERYRGIIPQSATHADVFVAINAQYHDYCELFKAWFGDNIYNKIIESAINFWFKDDDYKGGSKVWKYFMNM